MVLQYILQDTGVAITAAESGAEAVRLCSDEQYDLLLIDYMMPGMDGIEALQEIRRKGTKNIDTKAIMLSANAVEGAGELYLEAGFSNYLLKPVLPKKLRKMVRKYLFFENIRFFPEKKIHEKSGIFFGNFHSLQENLKQKKHYNTDNR